MRDLATGASRSRVAIALTAILLGLAQSALLVHTAWDKSDTVDETRYLASATTLAATGSFRDLCEAPVLPKWGFGIALRLYDGALAGAPPGWQRASAFLFDGKSPGELRRLLLVARLATIVVMIGGGIFLFATARRFGDDAALVTYTLWCFSPTVLAHGSLATLDGWAAAAMCVVGWAALGVLANPTLGWSVALGAAFGLAAATKITTLVALPIALCLLAAQLVRTRPLGAAVVRSTVLVVAIVASSVLVIWGLYGFTVGGVDTVNPCPFTIAGAPSSRGWLPFPAWIEGIVFQLQHGRTGHANYLFGKTSSSGWWWFYLASLLFKTTIGAQFLFLVALATMVVRAKRLGVVSLWVDGALLVYPVVLLILLSAGNHQANISFLLPAAPLAMLWTGYALSVAHRMFGRRTYALAAGLLIAGAMESLHVHPHHLMFFNAWAGGPEGGPRYLIHRDDWGQDKRRLAEWQHAHHVDKLLYAAYGPRPEAWGLIFDPVPCEPHEGIYALHAVEVHRPQYTLQPGCIDWLTVEPPDERIGYSIYIYSVDAARLERLEAERHAGRQPFWRSG